MIQTTNCVKCGTSQGPFRIGGHVHKDKEDVIASVCQKCAKEEENTYPSIKSLNGCKGCYGQWIPAYGYEKNDFGEVLELSSKGFKKL